MARDEASVGRVISGGDVTVAGRRVAANTLAAAGALQLEATDTDIVVAEIDGGGGTLRARRDVLLSALSAQDALGVEAGRDIQIGDGLSEAKGLIRLVAGRDISAELAAATFAEAIASENVALRVGTLRAGVVSGGEVHAEGGQVRIDEVTSAGDIYVRALSGEARVDRATAGDDVYVLATHGDAVLGSARGTGLAPDTVGLSFSGNPDRAGNGRVVQVDSSDLDARLGLAGTGAVERAVTRVNVQAGRDAQVELAGETAGALQIQAMRDASLTAPTARLEAVNAGRDVTLTSLSGGFSANQPLIAARNLTVVAAGAVRLGQARADAGSLSFIGASVAADLVVAKEDLTLKARAGGVSVGAYEAGRDLSLEGAAIELAGGLKPVGRDLSVVTSGAFRAPQPLIAGRNLMLDVAQGAALGEAAAGGTVSLRVGGLLSLDAASGASIQVEAGELRLQRVDVEALRARQDLSITTQAALTLGDLRAEGGTLTLQAPSLTTGRLTAGLDLTLVATAGDVSADGYAVGRDLAITGVNIDLGQTLAPVARDLSITALGGFSASGDLAAGRRMTVRVAGDGTFAGLKAGGDLELETAGQLRLGSAQGANVTLTASDLQAEGDVVGALIVIASRAGALEVGGSEPTTQALHLSAAEFGRLGASSEVRLSAGASLDGPQRDLLLRDLAIDPSRTPSVVFRVGAGAVARVVGRVVPTSDGGSLRIGDATELGWRPQRIEVTGSLGDALFADGAYTQIKGFTEVKLAARKDILVGPSRFIDLVRDLPASDVNVQGGKPAGVAPLGDEAYRIYIATQRLAVSADEKVIQQNTAPDGSSGLLFTRPAQAVLTIDPPKTVELFGVNFDSDGRLAMGPDAARNLSAMVVDAAGQPIATPPGARYRFNTCDLNSGFCLGPGVSDEPKGLPQETGVVLSNGGTLAAFDLTSGGNLSARTPVDESAVSGQGLTTSAPLLEIRPAETDTPETDLVVTGTGSEEIWRKRRRSREP